MNINLEEIMKPYFDKQEQLNNKNNLISEKYEKENQEYEKENISLQNEINHNELRLERLRDNKEKEIEQYVTNATSEGQSFYGGYAAMIRKDLEQAYFEHEKKLEKEIETKKALIEENVAKINSNKEKLQEEISNNNKYYRVDIRELSNIKNELRSPLYEAKKGLELQLEQLQVELDIVGLQLKNFRYQYDEERNPLNGKDFKALWDKSNALIFQKDELKQKLEKIHEYETILEPTEEEIKIGMMAMTSWEKEEFDRRRFVNAAPIFNPIGTDLLDIEVNSSDKDEFEIPEINISKIDEEVENPGIEESNLNNETLEISLDDEIQENYLDEEKTVDEVDVVASEILGDIISSGNKLRRIKINDGMVSIKDTKDTSFAPAGSLDNLDDSIILPNGQYLNENDFSTALNNYYNKPKGKTYKLNGLEKTIDISKNIIRKITKGLKNCASFKLLNEKKLSSTDIKSVYGTQYANELYNEEVKIGEIVTKVPDGEYVNLKEMYDVIKNSIINANWKEKIKKIFTSFKADNKENIVEQTEEITNLENEQEQIEEVVENVPKYDSSKEEKITWLSSTDDDQILDSYKWIDEEESFVKIK